MDGHLEALPTELLHHIAFTLPILPPPSILALVLTSHTLYSALLGPLGDENPLDMAKFRSKSGLVFCISHGWERAALLALPATPTHLFPSLFPPPLSLAAEHGFSALTTALLSDSRVDPCVENNEAVFLACRNLHTPVLSALLSDPRIDPFQPDPSGVSLLEAACEVGHTDAIPLLLDLSFHHHNAKITTTLPMAVLTAAEFGHAPALSLLLAHPDVDPSHDSNAAVRYAARYGHTEAVSTLLAHPRVDPSDHFNYALRDAAANGHTLIVSLLLSDPRVDPSALNNDALRSAIANNHTDIIALLSSVSERRKMSDGNAGLEELAVEVVQKIVFESGLGCRDVVAVGLASKTMYGKVFGKVGEENEFDVDQHKALAGVSFCVEREWWRAGRLAVERGYGDVMARMDCEDRLQEHEAYPLSWAAKAGETELVKVLLDHPNVDPNGDYGYGFDWACLMGHDEVVKVLLEDGRVEVEGEGREGLVMACRFGRVEVVRMLLEDGRVDPGRKGVGLRIAARLGWEGVVKVLLEDGRVEVGERVLKAARKGGHGRVVAMLLSKSCSK